MLLDALAAGGILDGAAVPRDQGQCRAGLAHPLRGGQRDVLNVAEGRLTLEADVAAETRLFFGAAKP